MQETGLRGFEASILGTGRSPGGGLGNPLQYSCLGNPMDRGAWQATGYEVSKSPTRLRMYAFRQKAEGLTVLLE